jgi:hypothetical protein
VRKGTAVAVRTPTGVAQLVAQSHLAHAHVSLRPRQRIAPSRWSQERNPLKILRQHQPALEQTTLSTRHQPSCRRLLHQPSVCVFESIGFDVATEERRRTARTAHDRTSWKCGYGDTASVSAVSASPTTVSPPVSAPPAAPLLLFSLSLGGGRRVSKAYPVLIEATLLQVRLAVREATGRAVLAACAAHKPHAQLGLRQTQPANRFVSTRCCTLRPERAATQLCLRASMWDRRASPSWISGTSAHLDGAWVETSRCGRS